METEIPREQLIEAAREVRKHAYAPYSSFRVGAAVLDESGRIHAGCNVENASYGLTNCAERVAIGRAIAEGARGIQALAVVSSGAVTPCGACRQVIAEFGSDCDVLIVDADSNAVSEIAFATLLPQAFGGNDLGKTKRS